MQIRRAPGDRFAVQMTERGLPPLIVQPIGVVRSPFRERLAAPRQPSAARKVEGTIELFPGSGIEHALCDLGSFRFIWVLFWFHKNAGFRPKVRPPRSLEKRGVFATRSPYRPNPIGISVVELLEVAGLELRVRNLDMLDGSPVLDIKPYLSYSDAIGDASNGWVGTAAQSPDPLPDYPVEFSDRADEQLTFLEHGFGIDLRSPAREVLKLGPTPHPYRRIKRDGEGWILAYKEWRLTFAVEGRRILVTAIRSGYRASEVYGRSNFELGAHRAFLDRFGA